MPSGSACRPSIGHDARIISLQTTTWSCVESYGSRDTGTVGGPALKPSKQRSASRRSVGPSSRCRLTRSARGGSSDSARSSSTACCGGASGCGDGTRSSGGIRDKRSAPVVDHASPRSSRNRSRHPSRRGRRRRAGRNVTSCFAESQLMSGGPRRRTTSLALSSTRPTVTPGTAVPTLAPAVRRGRRPRRSARAGTAASTLTTSGHKVPFGAHLRHLVFASRPVRAVVGCLLFSSPARRMVARRRLLSPRPSLPLLARGLADE